MSGNVKAVVCGDLQIDMGRGKWGRGWKEYQNIIDGENGLDLFSHIIVERRMILNAGVLEMVGRGDVGQVGQNHHNFVGDWSRDYPTRLIILFCPPSLYFVSCLLAHLHIFLVQMCICRHQVGTAKSRERC